MTGMPNTLTAENSAAESAASTSRSTHFWLAVGTLTQRELTRFFRQQTRVVGALGQPLIFWVLFGAGLRGSFQPPGWADQQMTFQEYFFPGVAVLILMFTAIFSTISIIEDRREGFLQGVLVAPVSRWALVLGKVFGGSLLAILQACLFLWCGPALKWIGLAPELSVPTELSGVLATLAVISLLAFTLTALGYVIAWPMESTQGFHAIMSVFLMPMWLLSGSFFPQSESGWLSWVIAANPLTYGVGALRRAMSVPNHLPVTASLPSWGLCLAVTIVFGFVCTALAVWMTGRQSAGQTR